MVPDSLGLAAEKLASLLVAKRDPSRLCVGRIYCLDNYPSLLSFYCVIRVLFSFSGKIILPSESRSLMNGINSVESEALSFLVSCA